MTTRTCFPSAPNGSRRSVKFARKAQVHIVPSLDQMSDDEIAATWTTDEDSKRTQRDIIKTIKAMRKSSRDADPEICTRGLEHMRSSAHLEQAKINKDCVFSAVLDLQERQRMLGIYDECELASASAHCSRWANDTAIERGQFDASFVHLMVLAEEGSSLTQHQDSPIPLILEKALKLSKENSADEAGEMRRKSDPGLGSRRHGALRLSSNYWKKGVLSEKKGDQSYCIPQPSLENNDSAHKVQRTASAWMPRASIA